MLDGTGSPVSTWTLVNPFIENADFSELDYSTSDLANVSLTLQYDFPKFEGETYSNK